jgi:flagellar basal-body rod modification protein FlgD
MTGQGRVMMSGVLMNSITAVGSAAAARVASALAPRAASKASAKDAQGPGASQSADGSTSSTASGATITSNDFLTLLVSELKNQDPTQPTDPNAYIQQLVGVNSLQQLISINQELAPLTPSTSDTGS